MKDFLIFCFQLFHALFMHNLLRVLKLKKQQKNFFSANSKNFSIGRMKNPRPFLISNRGRRTKFHYGFNDLGARSRKNLKTPKHAGSALPPLRMNSMKLIRKVVNEMCYVSEFWAILAKTHPNIKNQNENLFSII